MKEGHCTNCKGRRFRSDHVTETYPVGDLRFRVNVPARVCSRCGSATVTGLALGQAELAISAELVRTGNRRGEALRFIRATLGLGARELASKLHVTPETASRWENNKAAIDPVLFAVLGVMVREALGQPTRIQELLDAAVSKPGSVKPRTVLKALRTK